MKGLDRSTIQTSIRQEGQRIYAQTFSLNTELIAWTSVLAVSALLYLADHHGLRLESRAATWRSLDLPKVQILTPASYAPSLRIASFLPLIPPAILLTKEMRTLNKALDCINCPVEHSSQKASYKDLQSTIKVFGHKRCASRFGPKLNTTQAKEVRNNVPEAAWKLWASYLSKRVFMSINPIDCKTLKKAIQQQGHKKAVSLYAHLLTSKQFLWLFKNHPTQFLSWWEAEDQSVNIFSRFLKRKKAFFQSKIKEKDLLLFLVLLKSGNRRLAEAFAPFLSKKQAFHLLITYKAPQFAIWYGGLLQPVANHIGTLSQHQEIFARQIMLFKHIHGFQRYSTQYGPLLDANQVAWLWKLSDKSYIRFTWPHIKPLVQQEFVQSKITDFDLLLLVDLLGKQAAKYLNFTQTLFFLSQDRKSQLQAWRADLSTETKAGLTLFPSPASSNEDPKLLLARLRALPECAKRWIPCLKSKQQQRINRLLWGADHEDFTLKFEKKKLLFNKRMLINVSKYFKAYFKFHHVNSINVSSKSSDLPGSITLPKSIKLSNCIKLFTYLQQFQYPSTKDLISLIPVAEYFNITFYLDQITYLVETDQENKPMDISKINRSLKNYPRLWEKLQYRFCRKPITSYTIGKMTQYAREYEWKCLLSICKSFVRDVLRRPNSETNRIEMWKIAKALRFHKIVKDFGFLEAIEKIKKIANPTYEELSSVYLSTKGVNKPTVYYKTFLLKRIQLFPSAYHDIHTLLLAKQLSLPSILDKVQKKIDERLKGLCQYRRNFVLTVELLRNFVLTVEQLKVKANTKNPMFQYYKNVNLPLKVKANTKNPMFQYYKNVNLPLNILKKFIRDKPWLIDALFKPTKHPKFIQEMLTKAYNEMAKKKSSDK